MMGLSKHTVGYHVEQDVRLDGHLIPGYLKDHLLYYQPSHALWSPGKALLVVPSVLQ